MLLGCSAPSADALFGAALGDALEETEAEVLCGALGGVELVTGVLPGTNEVVGPGVPSSLPSTFSTGSPRQSFQTKVPSGGRSGRSLNV